MAAHCTILCPADKPRHVYSLVRDLMRGRAKVKLRGPQDDWTSIEIAEPESSLTLTRRVFRKRGDEFARKILSLYTCFDAVRTKRPAIKNSLLQRIENGNLAIGVVAEPEFVDTAGHFECIFALADLTCHELLAPNG